MKKFKQGKFERWSETYKRVVTPVLASYGAFLLVQYRDCNIFWLPITIVLVFYAAAEFWLLMGYFYGDHHKDG